MITKKLIHPQILQSLAAAGHGSTILIADGHYPVSTGTNPSADRVYLNLMPGIPLVTEVAEALVDTVAIEAAYVMTPGEGDEPPVFAEFRNILGPELPLKELDRFAFYDQAKTPDLALAIATGDTRTYANLLLTIGVAQVYNRPR